MAEMNEQQKQLASKLARRQRADQEDAFLFLQQALEASLLENGQLGLDDYVEITEDELGNLKATIVRSDSSSETSRLAEGVKAGSGATATKEREPVVAAAVPAPTEPVPQRELEALLDDRHVRRDYTSPMRARAWNGVAINRITGVEPPKAAENETPFHLLVERVEVKVFVTIDSKDPEEEVVRVDLVDSATGAIRESVDSTSGASHLGMRVFVGELVEENGGTVDVVLRIVTSFDEVELVRISLRWIS